MAYELPNLPYAYNALEPHISAQTLAFHHDKHHAKYVNTFNQLAPDAGMADNPIEEVIKATYQGSANPGPLHNNAAQAWNHTFYWNCMKPGGGGIPTGTIAEKINSDIGSYQEFKEQFTKAAPGQFGSGYVWLVLNNGRLEVTNSPNAVNPMSMGMTPLLTMDVWEHAYYLDYQNARAKYAETFVDNLINWDYVNQQLAAAQ
ncbi:MAG: superoxide dismutase [Fe] [Cyanobacteria bacterium QH_8_48_120]|jgi:Fe-Mn family superoxide dismutase|nr:MAG: superoxide dismutase [Fe] [Cyanobacteria bacterium QH_10_48_56]PSO66230.1 MAG: superoxide dismutase [Fe] [Cyanobacteria bacterium QH_6_48_35]PSO68078.1 MAG: superoxide dismutase [Fe] [Cyanobacteria bacterium QH_7_48_89]PSO71583.1 MAG: superoxide dismutase [Fe] [Cyanobacteria bacterium QH_3_48_40]PSO75275.1 MAG: superoxide dismutase [Fe] [Cyanobacteria bacterium QH_8_48_120]PSO77051.1 MAG: superoxide dismutase [Fe] [Cyanobacteria bacterium QS_4_48_99]PSO81102.1 MAG: superoxide dismutas